MKRRLFIPILFTSLLLSSCEFKLPFGPVNPTSSETETTDTSSTSEPEKTPVVTSVTLNKKSATLKPGGSLTLIATVTGENNPAETLTWTSSDENVATVAGGVVVAKANAESGTSTTITATSTVTPTVSASCTVKISSSDTYTILMHICGADLESASGLATSDLKEILSVADQPENVNIVIQTGGASSWQSTYGITASKLCRFEVRNKKLTQKESLTYASMGLSSTLQSFIEYGMKNYSAAHMGFIFWNHGGAVNGACYDERKNDDSLIASETDAAFKNAFKNVGFNGKLDWVGYDCCIMSYADLAAIHADYFNYMVASQELEAGEGWDYDKWIPTLYEDTGVETKTLLAKICDTFVSDNGGNSSSNDQTLAVLDLTKMGTFTTEFEKIAAKITSSNYSLVGTSFNNSLRFAKGSSYGSRYDYGLSDMKDFLTKLTSAGTTFDTAACITALADVTVHCAYSKNYYTSTKPCGVNVFFAPSTKLSGMQIMKKNYTASDTKFTSYQQVVTSNGKFYS